MAQTSVSLPALCRAPLPRKAIQWQELERRGIVTIPYAKVLAQDKIAQYERVLWYDVEALYGRIGHLINPTARHQGLAVEQIFVPPDRSAGVCACGCSTVPATYSKPGAATTLHYRWATSVCSEVAGDVTSIINNYWGRAGFYTTVYAGTYKCSMCPETHMLDLDHIVPVKHGGGGSWLSNYQWLCKKCHREKTNKDFNHKQTS